jgi:hypothetical protein
MLIKLPIVNNISCSISIFTENKLYKKKDLFLNLQLDRINEHVCLSNGNFRKDIEQKALTVNLF